MKSVMGFEFDVDDAKKIKNNDTALRVLASLQEHGVAIVSDSGYKCLPDSFLNIEGEYWTAYTNDRESEVALVIHGVFKVFEN